MADDALVAAAGVADDHSNEASDSPSIIHTDGLAALTNSSLARDLISAHVAQLRAGSSSLPLLDAVSPADIFSIGAAALDAFLQANVTGPVLPTRSRGAVEGLFIAAWQADPKGADTLTPADALHQIRKAALVHLEVDGVSPYAYIPHLELFSLARFIFLEVLEGKANNLITPSSIGTGKQSITWTGLRIHVWHYKLLTQPSLGPGSNFTRSSQWSEVPTLTTAILGAIDAVKAQVVGTEVWADDDTWSAEEKALFLVEAAGVYISLGRHEKGKESLQEAVSTNGFLYALSGALGKRTKFQENSTSQLVVVARSKKDGESIPTEEEEDETGTAIKPDALQLNDDTLFEEIQFNKDHNGNQPAALSLPAGLKDLAPDNQPQLTPLDQIILLTEATIKDAFSPVDLLTSEEILPFAVRVISDKSTNWQIYTQALLVRSRIEVHRSRTVERGILQLQVVADQVLTDTTAVAAQKEEPRAQETSEESDVPEIQVTEPGQSEVPAQSDTPTTFLPAPKASESAPAHARLQYIHALSSPPRWHLESELAHAWAGVGSLASALEIFKRLRLWAEVALCLASAGSADDEEGRGNGGEDKARGIIRWRLFHRSGDAASISDPDDENVGDVTRLQAADFTGPERNPPPSNAARLWCILGELENDPSHYERAWEISKHRYARAQKSLGEYYIQQKDWEQGREAYKKATAVNRLSPEMWGRLGDISLRLADFEQAAEAYSRSIACANDTAGGEDARTWSNLGSSLWSLYCEIIDKDKDAEQDDAPVVVEGDADEDEDESPIKGQGSEISRRPGTLLAQAFSAYKKGASIAHDNWRIWDNVLTLASRVRPIPVADMLLALTSIMRIRRTEDAIDVDVLSALLQDVVLTKDKDDSTGIYEPPRGSMERLITRVIEEQVIPLITRRSELWALVSRLRGWRRDYAGAIDASERAWRAATGSSSGGSTGLLPGDGAAPADWTVDETAWAETVKRTDELVSVLENWGPNVETVGPRWRSKARSAVRSVMGKAKLNWEDSEGWKTLEALLEGLKVERE